MVSCRHFCVFDVKENEISMKVLACGNNPNADIKDLGVIDEKTFRPRS